LLNETTGAFGGVRS